MSEAIVTLADPTAAAVDDALRGGASLLLLVGEDAARLGDLALRVEAAGARPAVFIGVPQDVAVAEAIDAFVGELFGPRTLAT